MEAAAAAKIQNIELPTPNVSSRDTDSNNRIQRLFRRNDIWFNPHARFERHYFSDFDIMIPAVTGGESRRIVRV